MEIKENCATTSACGDQTDGDKVSEQVTSSPDKAAAHHDEEQMAGGPKFFPPVYRQRYGLVMDVLQKHAIESVVDFGCAECKIARFLRTLGSLQRLALVDVDKGVLQGCRRFIDPDFIEVLMPSRRCPLKVSVLCGSAALLDARLVGFQAASLVEVIEHLEPDVLQQVTHNVFGRLRPSVVIVTTPNADFNVLFPNFTGFRHYDHKFEWTREEFQQWCAGVCAEHGYTVTYTGVGDPPPDSSHLGSCSQVAIFTEASGKAGEQTDEEVYELVYQADYPYDKRTSADRMAGEIEYIVSCASRRECYKSVDYSRAVVPVSLVHEEVQHKQSSSKEQWTEEQITEYIQTHFTLTDKQTDIVVKLEAGSSDGTEDDPDLPEVPGHSDNDDDDNEDEDGVEQQSPCMEKEEPWA